ncbi:uncharacterized protein Bfra_002411 [Botrytis fragariae]|uniref:Uncharacterized protein n=1 Tax=Botrytis fragariae TaxID=1964551 RepID=A0A8H6EKY4_9HELO|nr:uncharacterized protein Bfra_002411 [Botrytis fragariae]KAF5876014.1 hypothetical protein Bfra_002411 [Botrytis fragariae]
MSCDLESSFEASRNSYYDEEEQGDYYDPIQIDCNPSNHLNCFDSCDHLERYKSFQKFIEPLHEARYELADEYRDLTREYARVNRIYARSLNEFIGSSIKFSPPERRDSIRSDCRPLDPSNLCVCCDCFLELVAHYLESVIEMEFMQTYINIFKIEHRELVEKTLSLRWEIDNNQVNAEELADMLDAEDRKDLGHPYNPSSGHILHILEKAMSSVNRGNVTALSVCGNDLISPAALETILAVLPNLKDVYLLNISEIPLLRKLKILQGKKDLYALPFAYREKFYNDQNSRRYNNKPIPALGPKLGSENKEASRTNDISEESQSFMNDMSKFYHLLEDGMPPFCDLDCITPVTEQMIYITCGETDENSIRDSEGGLDILNRFQKKSSSHSGIDGPGYHAMPLKETNRHPFQLVQSLARFIGFSFSERHMWFSDLRKTLVKILAMEPIDDIGPGY